MEPDSYSETSQIDYERYKDLKEQLNDEINRWAQYSEETEDFIKTNDL
jgi:hypothetical protein